MSNFPYNSVLVFADGRHFFGRNIGSKNIAVGEVCFNTALTGYQEILTDPSYSGQIINFTFPHIGNIGTNLIDIESDNFGAVGLIIGNEITTPSNHRSSSHFNSWLEDKEISGISGVDTRAITKYIRDNGAQNVVISYCDETTDINALAEVAKNHRSLAGLDLAIEVSSKKPYEWQESLYCLTDGYKHNNENTKHIVAIDYGCKLNILRHFAELGCRITVVHGQTPAKDILALEPDGVFLSNGPGDPDATGKYSVAVIKDLLANNVPLFGICLGHQMLGLALGGKTRKMEQGHRGANHPVKNLATNIVEITSQNHGFEVDEKSLPSDVEITHISLFDGSVEGIRHKTKKAFSVQYHPESSPGPHDSRYLFKQFVAEL
jgi:carbamoyl-phosphate synthase small subunit